MITEARTARLERMLEERVNYYQKKWKDTQKVEYLTQSMAYNTALLLLLYAETEQDDMINQFDYFTENK